MSVIGRGIKNTFRSGLRTAAFAIILAVSMGMAFAMLLANQAVRARLNDVRSQVGNTIIVRPAGIFGIQGGGKPLSEKQVDKLARLKHVVRVNKSVDFAMQQQNTQNQPSIFTIDSSDVALKTNLISALKPMEPPAGVKLPAGQSLPAPPIAGAGIGDEYNSDGTRLKLQQGRYLKTTDTNTALVGKTLAAKNKLSIGSTFSIKDKTFTVVGIIDTDTEFAGNSVKIPFKTAQQLTGHNDQVLAATVQIDSIDNLEALKKDVVAALGKDQADVTASQPEAYEAIKSLHSVEQISLVALLIALGASALIVFLTMMIVVRERVKEIGILKALGASDSRVILQFITEATTLTFLSTLLGLGVALLAGDAILSGLLSSHMGADPSLGGAAAITSQAGSPQALPSVHNTLLGNIVTLVDWHLAVYGLVAVMGLAVLGSAIPSWFVARVRPAKVMRSN